MSKIHLTVKSDNQPMGKYSFQTIDKQIIKIPARADAEYFFETKAAEASTIKASKSGDDLSLVFQEGQAEPCAVLIEGYYQMNPQADSNKVFGYINKQQIALPELPAQDPNMLGEEVKTERILFSETEGFVIPTESSFKYIYLDMAAIVGGASLYAFGRGSGGSADSASASHDGVTTQPATTQSVADLKSNLTATSEHSSDVAFYVANQTHATQNDAFSQSESNKAFAIQPNTYKMPSNAYLNMANISSEDVLDVSGNGQQNVYLLLENALSSRAALNVYVKGSGEDKIMLDNKWEKSDQVHTEIQGTEEVTYQAYNYLGHTLWVDQDITPTPSTII